MCCRWGEAGKGEPSGKEKRDQVEKEESELHHFT